jgi:hypothetical protein
MPHITEIETMAIHLHAVGPPVTPQIMTKIICTLPPSYRSFTTAWDSVPANEKTNIPLLTSRLLKEETMAKRFNRGEQDSLATFLLQIPLWLLLNPAHQHVDVEDVESNVADHQDIIHIQNAVIATSLITGKKYVVSDFESGSKTFFTQARRINFPTIRQGRKRLHVHVLDDKLPDSMVCIFQSHPAHVQPTIMFQELHSS